MTEHKAITRRDVEVALQASKRPKVLEKRLLTKNDSTLQNIILIETELGAEVELHEIRTSESIYILSGTYELILPDKSENLKEGDLAFFPPKSLHGLRCVAGSGKFLAVFSPSADGEVSNEWLRAIYAESWRQYTHENVLSQQRNTLFTSVQAALIAFLAGVSKPLLDITPIQVEGANLSIGLGVLGFFAIVSSVFCLFITFYWDSVTKAGQGYIKVRWAVARMIESQAFLGNIGLANVEERWKAFSPLSPDQKFKPYPDYLENLQISPNEKIGGWNSIHRLIIAFRLLWIFILIFAIILVVSALLRWSSCC